MAKATPLKAATRSQTAASHDLVYRQGRSNKFWHIERNGSSFTVRFGRAGTAGQEQTKKFSSVAEAEKAYHKLVAEKLKKGYRDASAPVGSPVPADAATEPGQPQICESEAKELVESYIRGFYERWKSVAKTFAKGTDFARWSKLVRELDKQHFVPGSRSGEDGCFGSPSPHHPNREKITGFVPEEDDVARLQTTTDKFGPTFREYELRLVNSKLRIAKIHESYVPKGTPLVDRAKAKRILAAPSLTAKLAALPRGIEPNGDSLFEPRRVITLDKKKYKIEVRSLGEFATNSGVLAVRDFGYDGYGLAAFERKIPSGRYPLDVAIAAYRVAGLRLRLAETAVAAWHPATFVGKGYHAGVDGGNVALFDVAAFVELDVWEKEQLHAANADVERPNAHLFTLRDPNDCAIVDSGFGDGSYPCYWGVDRRGKIVRLFVDFLVAATFLEETVCVEYTGGKIRHSLLDEWGVKVEFVNGALRVRGSAFQEARFLRDGEVLAETRRDGGLTVRGDERTYDLGGKLRRKGAQKGPLTIEIKLSTGYRN